MIKLGSEEVTKIMKGSDEVLSVYKDNDEIWSPASDLLYYGTESLSGSRECYWTIPAGTFPTNRFTVETWFKSFGGANHGAYASFFGSWKNYVRTYFKKKHMTTMSVHTNVRTQILCM